MSTRDYRLIYLLKRAFFRLADELGRALAPYEIDFRELATLMVIDRDEPLSQHEVSRRLDVDRTTMVALVDALEGKELVTRRPDPADRRRNIVELTAKGRQVLPQAVKAADEVERRFLDPVAEHDAERLRAALRALL